jgi:hypothetical protein
VGFQVSAIVSEPPGPCLQRRKRRAPREHADIVTAPRQQNADPATDSTSTYDSNAHRISRSVVLHDGEDILEPHFRLDL